MGKAPSSHSVLNVISKFWHHTFYGPGLLRNTHMRFIFPRNKLVYTSCCDRYESWSWYCSFKYNRNTVYGHTECASVDDATFTEHMLKRHQVRLGETGWGEIQISHWLSWNWVHGPWSWRTLQRTSQPVEERLMQRERPAVWTWHHN